MIYYYMNRGRLIWIVVLIIIGVGCKTISKHSKSDELVTVYNIDDFPREPFDNCKNEVSNKLETFISHDSLFTIKVLPDWQYKYEGINENNFQRHVWYNSPDTTSCLILLIDVDSSFSFLEPNFKLSQDSCEWSFNIEKVKEQSVYDYWHYFACFSDLTEKNYYFFISSKADHFEDISFDISCEYRNSIESLIFFSTPKRK